jgi:hypothetical protein
MLRHRALSLALIGFALVLCAGSGAEAVPARNQRPHRAGRSARLTADHPSDSSHEGETISLDAHFERQSQLDFRGESAGDGEPLTVAALPASAPDFNPFRHSAAVSTTPDVPFPALLAQTNVRGRAPPSSVR